ncbi:CPBP family intramembrane glutamic endopeptidase [Micromonospora rubida]|uniref:CPBP family intramembrane glutamic endopeptidase n=1 Tax=Micromonospora rubida TaxID=2697657 RepID=UPI00137864D2|nr:type II CAAX endopeptidase family protein [Micromonospora rubida]NBE83594.1 CPBP family intramembrane metalloprotease [Micromonospora rubida]
MTTIIVAFLVASTAASPLFTLAQGLTGLHPTVLVLTQFSTAVGALAVYAIWRGRLPYPRTTKRGLLAPACAAVGLALAVILVLWLLAVVEPHRWEPLDTATLPAPLALILLAQFLGAAGEEVGWRGLVQPLLETRMPALLAAAVTGVFFGLGHFYVAEAGVAVYAVFVVSTIGLSVAAAAVTAGRAWWIRVLVATVLHWGVNIGTLVGFPHADDSMAWMTDTAIAMGLVGVACVPFLIRSTRRASTASPAPLTAVGA